jgi:acetyl-CoA synthetase
MISTLPGAGPQKPAHAGLPFFGVKPALFDTEGKELAGAAEGNLVITQSWPGQMRTVFRDHDRFVQTYFTTYKGVYTTGDGAKRDEDGYYRITGRVDDVINVSGHRFGTAEIEEALNSHSQIAESAVVGYPHDLKGQGIYAYVILNAGAEESDDLRKDIARHVRQEIGPIATPDVILITPGLPKTRSGKIMRRILRKVAEGAFDQLGDTSTLADPSVVEGIIERHKKITAKG